MSKYEVLSAEVSAKIEEANRTGNYPDTAFKNKDVVLRQKRDRDVPTVWRPTFAHDIDRIMYCPYYNRYTDKTQVFSLWKNDDITRRSLHVQLVSRISRTIGAALHLNLDLIEAISLGHDIGHTPFGHTGEKFLDELSFGHTGRHFYHNIHSVRVLDGIFPLNLSLQTLNGIAAHNGEIECEEYYPQPVNGFDVFDDIIEKCYTDPAVAKSIMPSTLEGAVVRLSDIIAYLGKDRQDARIINPAEDIPFDDCIGSANSEIINNLVVNVIENSYGKPYIKLDEEHFNALRKYKMENYKLIYNRAALDDKFEASVKPMMEEIYCQLLDDLKQNNRLSPVFTNHIDYVNSSYRHKRDIPYENSDHHQIIVDYIASMTDDYFISLHHYLFPESKLQVEYKGYFDK